MAEVKVGLQDVVIANSEICSIDGQRGKLVYRGYDIHDLAENSTFEEVVYLLWNGRLPKRAELEDLHKQLAEHRPIAPELADLMKRLPPAQHPMEALRTAVSALSLYDPESEDRSEAANRRKALRLTAQMGTVVAALGRIRDGKDPVAPDGKLSHAANFLTMLTGKAPDAESARWFDVALILHADHSYNASTFAARVTASTLSDMHSAIVSGIGTLKGPLHGGANEQVMKMLLEIQAMDKAEPYVRDLLAQKKKVMGFGHRVYHTEDPRATVLRRMSEELGRRAGQPKWFEMSKRIEDLMIGEKKINANVDFYSASAYYVLGIPTDLYPLIFAVSRISGWTAHVLEQYANNKLIRPLAEYVGPKDLKYVPIDRR
ncbi:MAG: citrate synthase [Acidobacteria bacterium]|nr:citrate synthase [Acidobacteriota bacterium]MBI1983521.1 citrate synthase [Acidobacteriota bacterium]